MLILDDCQLVSHIGFYELRVAVKAQKNHLLSTPSKHGLKEDLNSSGNGFL